MRIKAKKNVSEKQIWSQKFLPGILYFVVLSVRMSQNCQFWKNNTENVEFQADYEGSITLKIKIFEAF